jgi:hypothetical protein
VLRILAGALTVLALASPGGAAAQEQVLSGNIVGLQLPMTLDGVQVSHLTPGQYTFSLLDQSSQHSIHVRGPFDRPGMSAETVNFGTAGADGGNVAFFSPTRQIFPGIPLEDGLYRWFCDRHSDMMTGSVSVGNYLAVDVVNGGGTVTSEPAGLTCSALCGLGLPSASPPVTLTATPAPGYVFDRWSGGPCSGPGPCTLSVSGKVEVKAFFRQLTTPPPPAEVAPISLRRVRIAFVSGRRVVALRLNVRDHAQALAQLRRRGRTLASVQGHLLPGERTLKIRVPNTVKAGEATVRLSFKALGSTKTFVVLRTVTLPRPR